MPEALIDPFSREKYYIDTLSESLLIIDKDTDVYMA